MVVEFKGMYSYESYIIETDDNESLFRVLALAEGSGVRTKILNTMATSDENNRSRVAGTIFPISDFYKIGGGIKGLVDSAILIQKYFDLVKEKAEDYGSLLPYNGEYVIPGPTITAFELAEFIR